LYFFATTLFLPVYFPGTRQRSYLSLDAADFMRLALILSTQVLACYAAIYYLLPRYLMKARYFQFLGGIIFLVFLAVLACRFIYVKIMPFVEPVILNNAVGRINKANYWTSISDGGINSIKIIAAAMAIKLGKYWKVKQKEKERLDKEKIEAELQLLKAQIHPGFLFNTLNHIYSFALEKSPRAPEMLLRLSEILSYMLYECNDTDVALDKEIKMLRDYLALEKIRYGNKLELNFQVKGDISNCKIAPLLLLHFIENSFSHCSSPLIDQPWINLEVEVQNRRLHMKLMNGKRTGMSRELNGEDYISQAQRHMQLLYPGRYDLKIIEEPEIMMVNLEIDLVPVAGIDAIRSSFQRTELVNTFN